jgi:hypothetical protein
MPASPSPVGAVATLRILGIPMRPALISVKYRRRYPPPR